MRVALVHDWLTGMRGGEAVLSEIAAFFPEAPIFTLFHRPGTVTGELARHAIHTSFLQKLTCGGRWYRGLLSLMHYGVAAFDLEGYDLVVSSSHCVAKGIIPPPGAVHLCYCHTPMRYLWDQREEYLRRMSPLLRPLVRAKLEDLRAWDVVSAARVDHFIANSQLVAKRIERYWRRQAEVVPPPIEVDFFSPGDLREDYVLMVAALVPYKRVDVGMAVADRLGKPLHIVGEGPLGGRLRRAAGPRVRFLGHLDAAALREQFRRAALLLVPNVEDFGMVAVEALACGTPVVGLAASGTADAVRGGVHGELAADGSVAALAAACENVMGREWDRALLRKRAESFSRQRFRQRFGFLLERHVPGYRQA
ncbi:MAG: glycosyltransferase [Thermoanaerobaculaceae bacterium]